MLQIVNVEMVLQVKRFTCFFEYKFDDFANQQDNAKNNKPRNSLQHAEFPYSSSDRTVCTIAALTASSARYFSFPRWEYRRSTIMARPMPYMRQQGKETIQQRTRWAFVICQYHLISPMIILLKEFDFS